MFGADSISAGVGRLNKDMLNVRRKVHDQSGR